MKHLLIILILLSVISTNKTLGQTMDKNNPAYKEYSSLERHLASIKKYYDKGQFTSTMATYLGYAEKSINKLKTEYESVNISSLEASYKTYKDAYDEKQGNDGSAKEQLKDDAAYFLKWVRLADYFYHETTADGARGLKGGDEEAIATYEKVKGFTRADFMQKIEDSKKHGTYDNCKVYINKFLKVLDGYDEFIAKAEDLFYEYIKDMDYAGTKGNPTKEMQQLVEAEAFCKVLLTFSPDNADAKSWLKQVESRMGNKKKTITESTTSDFHQQHINQVVFSKKPLSIGSETEGDITTNFTSGDEIYGTIYLSTKVRELQKSYALLYMNIYVDGEFLATTNETGIWITTPMQEKTYVQFALSPSDTWIKQNYQPYIDEEQYSLAQFNELLARKGAYQHKVEIEIKFRNSAGGKIKGVFRVDLSNGTDFYQTLAQKLKGKTMSAIGLPKKGMSNTTLEKQMLNIMNAKSSGGQKYIKAVIVSTDWDTERSYNGTITGRSVSAAMVSKKSDGTCMYQNILFAQDYTGSGYSDKLKFAGAGDNKVLPCENIK